MDSCIPLPLILFTLYIKIGDKKTTVEIVPLDIHLSTSGFPERVASC